ncbi:MAG: hypothetical protein HC941_16005 [Microcoleus sp. SU_5_3]|nr:hypothetical protein [Microcoleus sp. SU_5_3]
MKSIESIALSAKFYINSIGRYNLDDRTIARGIFVRAIALSGNFHINSRSLNRLSNWAIVLDDISVWTISLKR